MENPDAGIDKNAHLWLLGGSVLLALSGTVDAAGPERAPRAFTFLLHLATAIGGLSIAAYLLRKSLDRWIGLITASLGLTALAVGLGVAPELFALPMGGIGERFAGFPVALLAPIAGIAWLRGLPVVAGTSAALLVLGHFQPVAIMSVVKPAVFFHLVPFNGAASLSHSSSRSWERW